MKYLFTLPLTNTKQLTCTSNAIKVIVSGDSAVTLKLTDLAHSLENHPHV